MTVSIHFTKPGVGYGQRFAQFFVAAMPAIGEKLRADPAWLAVFVEDLRHHEWVVVAIGEEERTGNVLVTVHPAE